MLNNSRPENMKERFQKSVGRLDRTIKKAQLIHKIEVRSRESETATPEELIQILTDLKSYREQIRLLDQEDYRC